MAVPKTKQRITITIHNETKQLLDELASLHEKSSYSNIVEVALIYYTTLLEKQMSAAAQENAEEKEHKNQYAKD